MGVEGFAEGVLLYLKGRKLAHEIKGRIWSKTHTEDIPQII